VLFGINPERHLPGSYVQYVRFEGKDRAGEIRNEHKFSGNLCRELIKIDAFIETSISQKRPIPVSVLREETVAKYPYWATRELLMNAIMHRDYQTNAPVLFYEYDDRIEVQNPGGLYGKVSEDNFPNVSDYRNPFIAEAMKILGYVNRFSRGVYRVQKELVENGNGEARFDFSLITAFKVVENVSKRYFEAGFGADESGNPKETAEKPPRNPQETPKKLREQMIDAIRKNPQITRNELVILFNRTPESIRHHLEKLTKDGVIKHTGSTKAGEWIILKKP
jgi:ATP-dependent DNA helicase RecG